VGTPININRGSGSIFLPLFFSTYIAILQLSVEDLRRDVFYHRLLPDRPVYFLIPFPGEES
jgi:hypothetical protein